MKKLIYLGLVLFVLLAFSVSAFNFYGYTNDVDGNALNNTNISMEIYTGEGEGPPTLITTFNGTSIASGWFNVSNITSNSSCSYKPVVRHYNSTTGDADYVSQSLPDLPHDEIVLMRALDNITFFLREGGTINITAINSSGDNINFSYMIKDTKLGYPVSANFDSMVASAIVYVPADRNYSIMLYPDMSFPISYDLNNITDYAGNHADIIFNTSEQWRRVSGNINLSDGSTGFDNISIINFIYEIGMISQNHPAPYNISAWNGETDLYNATTGSYNITLPGSIMTAKFMMFALAKKGSSYYGAFRNISLNYSNASVTSWNFNLTELLGTETTITLDKAVNGPMENITIPLKKVSFQLQNASGSAISQSAFTETEVDYTSLTDGASFKWMQDVSADGAGILKIPLLSGMGVKKMNIYSQQFAPKKTSFTDGQLTGTVGINLSSNNEMGKGVDDEAFSDLFIDMIISSAVCDVPDYNMTACSLFPQGQEMNMTDFNPFKIVLGGGKISFVMRKDSNNITVHYKNVDMLASGPPDALFDNSANETEAGSSLEMAWRFGSMGPEIYDEVLIGIPLGSEVDYNAPISILLKNLYDENWNTIWNVDINGTPNSSSDLPTDYQDFNLTWFNKTISGMSCSQSDNTSQCYVNNQTGIAWLTIPHFSGIGPAIQSVTTGNMTMAADAASYDCTESCLVYFNITNQNYTIAQSLHNITISTVDINNNIANISVYWFNNSAADFDLHTSFIGNGTNSTNHTDYNVTRYNGSASTLHRYRLNITKSANPGTRLNITYNITDLSLDLMLSLSLNCVENWTYTSWSTCSGGTQTRTATDGNSCGTTNDQLALSQSCTLPTSGGGAPSVTTLSSAPVKKTLSTYGVHYFKVKGDISSHKVRIKTIEENGAWLMFNSDQVDVFIEVGETKLVDVNGDGKIDVVVTLESMTSNSVQISVSQATGEEVVEEESVVEEEVVEEEPVIEEVIGEGVVPVESDAGELPTAQIGVKGKTGATLGVILLIIAAILLVLLIVLSAVKKKKKTVEAEEKKTK